MEISGGAACRYLPLSRARRSSLYQGAAGLLHLVGVPSCPPTSRRQALTFEGELDPWGGEAVVLGVGGPPAQSQQGGPEEDTDHGHGGHAPGRRGRGESGGVGGPSLPKRAQWGARSLCCTRHQPPSTPGGTNPASPHPALGHPLARSILRGQGG